MKKIFYSFAVLAMTAGFTACETPDNGDGTWSSDKEDALKAVITAYVDKTIVPTYKGMADNSILLAEACDAIFADFETGSVETSLVEKAGNHWNNARDFWERSEAFLYGAAADYNIDPHIDSWPLDKNAMDELLERLRKGGDSNLDNLGYGLLGFHAVEYMLFELSDDGTVSHPHNTNYTREELVYLCAVAEDLRNQCILLHASWAGMENISDEEAAMLEEADLAPTRNYGEIMKNAGKAGSTYKTYQEAAEDLVQGCIDIADEVGNTKIGRPVHASSDEDKNYIESPYSLNSINDFVGNIISIRNAYCGSNAGDASLSDYIRSVNADLDARLRAQIETAIDAIEAIPEPFVKSASGAAAENAVTVVGTDLVEVLEKVMSELSKH